MNPNNKNKNLQYPSENLVSLPVRHWDQNKIAVLIPAYNEESRIGKVLDVVVRCNFVDEIIVVDDGSEDRTAQMVENYSKVYLISYHPNKGKAHALCEGLKVVNSDITLFLDADLIKLDKEHIEGLINPVFSGKVTTTIGNFKDGRLCTDFGQALWGKDLSGQRAAKTEFWKKVFNEIDDEEIEKMGFGIEDTITSYIKTNKIDAEYVSLEGVTHIMKEEKNGAKGFYGPRGRIPMYQDLARSKFKRAVRWTQRQQKTIQGFLKGD